MINVAVVDYGVGNLLSVRRALEHFDAHVNITSDPEAILSADRVVLPGVGSFEAGMAALCENGLDKVVRQVARGTTPLLGICLGMQLLLDGSEEFGMTAGLGLIPGRVVQIPGVTSSGEGQKIPHIGWNALVPGPQQESWTGTLLAEVTEGEAVYFVHSFMAVPSESSDIIAQCVYGGHRLTAAIGRANVMGFQFHPEKSGAVGLRVLHRFLSQ